MRGTYHYRVRNGMGGFTDHAMPVEILGENKAGTTYRIKYLQFHASGTPPGHITFAYKRNVTVAGAQPAMRKPAKTPTWQPYKD